MALLCAGMDAITSVHDMEEAARRLVACGAQAALVKGGHLKEQQGFSGKAAVGSLQL